LTVKILKIVNSAYYGFYREIGNVNHAIVILGFNEIKNIALAACIIGTFPASVSRLFNREQFWLHCLGVAFTAGLLSKYTPGLNSNDAFVIGLLHDIGIVVLDQHFNEVFLNVVQEAHTQQRPLVRVETEILGLDHAEIGGIVADQWELPVPLVRGIRYHHRPSQGGKEDLSIHLAHLSNYFCHRHTLGYSGNPVPDNPYKGSLKRLGLTLARVEELWTARRRDFERLNTII